MNNSYYFFEEDLYNAIIQKHTEEIVASLNKSGVKILKYDRIAGYVYAWGDSLSGIKIHLSKGKEHINSAMITNEHSYDNLYFVLHSSEEGFGQSSHFQIDTEKLGKFWLNRDEYSKLRITTLFFMHEEYRCTVYSSFLKALKEATIEGFLDRIREVFSVHNIESRNRLRQNYLEGLGYGTESLVNAAGINSEVINTLYTNYV